MDALEALLGRTSARRLGGEMPEKAKLDNVFKAALRAPDHGLLHPWRYLLVSGEARQRLGDLFAQAQRETEPEVSDATLDKTRAKPLRAPLIVVVIASLRERPNVPDVEQLISAGAAAENMMLAAYAQGLGAMWRTGAMAYSDLVHRELGLEANERIVGFLYLGHAEGQSRSAPELPIDEFFKKWPGEGTG